MAYGLVLVMCEQCGSSPRVVRVLVMVDSGEKGRHGRRDGVNIFAILVPDLGGRAGDGLARRRPLRNTHEAPPSLSDSVKKVGHPSHRS